MAAASEALREALRRLFNFLNAISNFALSNLKSHDVPNRHVPPFTAFFTVRFGLGFDATAANTLDTLHYVNSAKSSIVDYFFIHIATSMSTLFYKHLSTSISTMDVMKSRGLFYRTTLSLENTISIGPHRPHAR